MNKTAEKKKITAVRRQSVSGLLSPVEMAKTSPRLLWNGGMSVPRPGCRMDASHRSLADKLQSLNGILQNSWLLTFKYWFSVYKSGPVSRQTASINIAHHLVSWLKCVPTTLSPQVWGAMINLSNLYYALTSCKVVKTWANLDTKVGFWEQQVFHIIVNGERQSLPATHAVPRGRGSI